MDTPPLYQQIANHYRQAIEAGTLRPAQRMPSVRALMRAHDVSLSTALQASRLLEQQGWIEARPRSGFFVRRVARRSIAPVPEPVSLAAFDPADFAGVHDRISSYVAQCNAHPSRVNFGTAVAAAEAYPRDLLQQALSRALRRRPDALVTTVPPEGDLGLRQVIAERALEIGINVAPSDVVITYGCTEALNLALRTVARAGDTIAIESPVYYGVLQAIESLGMRALEIPASPRDGLTPEALALAFAEHPDIKAVVVVPTYQNPLGAVMPDAAKARIAALCADRNVPVIEDDIYGRLHDGATLPRALKSWDSSGNVVYCSSGHKTLAPGIRVGWMIPGKWRRRASILKYANSRPNDLLTQMALADVMGSRGYERHLTKLRTTLREQREQMADAIAASFPAGTRLSMPQGGLVLWVELPERTSATQVFEAALREGIRIAPGTLFSNSPRFGHFVRINSGTRLTPEVSQAVARLGQIVAASQEQRLPSAA